MTDIACPVCTLDDVLTHNKIYECITCGHEWERTDIPDEDAPPELVVKDAYGNILQQGDIIQMIKDKKIKGSSVVLKSGDKSKPISLQEGDHGISCKINGISINLKAQFVKKVNP